MLADVHPEAVRVGGRAVARGAMAEYLAALVATEELMRPQVFIPHIEFFQSFRKSQFPHKSVNLFFILVIVKDKLTDLWGGGVDFFKMTSKTLCVR